MPLDSREVIRLVADLCENEDLKVAVTASAKGAVLTGLGAFVGGLMLGPAGLPIGYFIA